MRTSFLFIIIFLGCTTGYAQLHTKDFTIVLPAQKIHNSLYNTIVLVDSRSDTSSLGTAQTGVFNRKASVIATPALRTQLTGVLNALTDSTAQNGELLLQVRELN